VHTCWWNARVPPAENPDLAAALAWAAEVLGPLVGVRELTGGWTSTMLALTTGTGAGVLRLVTREPWRTHGSALTARESAVQRMLAGTGVPTPRSLALDADGRACGHPAHLMSLVPGDVDTDRVDAASLARLADLLAAIHAITPTIEVRTYQSWAWDAKFVVPSWAADPGVWQEAFSLLRTDPPEHEPCFIHRDFQLRNVLWVDDRVSGVVDWVETSIGPAWLDVAHCCTNIALRHGSDVADRFAAAYVDRTGREPQLYVDVMDIVGFLPPPGSEGFVRADEERRNLEQRLTAVLRQLRS
jgi:aminoglycoside phosphotransferase (APT) family kinase protein